MQTDAWVCEGRRHANGPAACDCTGGGDMQKDLQRVSVRGREGAHLPPPPLCSFAIKLRVRSSAATLRSRTCNRREAQEGSGSLSMCRRRRAAAA
eukprot:5274651-Prymnesium_polylepis.1